MKTRPDQGETDHGSDVEDEDRRHGIGNFGFRRAEGARYGEGLTDPAILPKGSIR